MVKSADSVADLLARDSQISSTGFACRNDAFSVLVNLRTTDEIIPRESQDL